MRTAPFSSSTEGISSVITKLQRIVKKKFRSFENNHMEANPGKSDVLLSLNIQKLIPSDNVQIISILSEKPVGIASD